MINILNYSNKEEFKKLLTLDKLSSSHLVSYSCKGGFFIFKNRYRKPNIKITRKGYSTLLFKIIDQNNKKETL